MDLCGDPGSALALFLESLYRGLTRASSLVLQATKMGESLVLLM